MAQGTNVFDRYDLGMDSTGTSDADNVREDLSDVIYNISPTEVPFQSNIGKERSENTYKEWLIDSLADAAQNAHIDGDEFTGDALTRANRVGNHHQISRKDIVVTRRANIVNKAGRRREVAYQIAKAGKELRRDIEFDSTKRHEAIVGAAGTAPQAAGLCAWITSNLERGTSGTAPGLSGTNDGYPNAVGTNGSDRVLKESDLLGVARKAYEEGGSPNMVLAGTDIKQGLSNYLFTNTAARVATQYQDQGKSPRGGVSVIGAVDVYVTDFQVLDIVPDRFSPGGATEAEVPVLDTEYWAMSYLDGYHVETIAQVGDHQRRMLLVDWTLCSKNEAASGLVADLTNGAVAA